MPVARRFGRGGFVRIALRTQSPIIPVAVVGSEEIYPKIANLPFVRTIYGGAKQVFKQIAAPERTSFKQAVLVEFPQPGSYAIGFITNENTAEVVQDIGEDLVAVYVPQAPIPTSGFLLYLPRNELKLLSIPPDEALKRVISLGIIRKEDELGAGK